MKRLLRWLRSWKLTWSAEKLAEVAKWEWIRQFHYQKALEVYAEGMMSAWSDLDEEYLRHRNMSAEAALSVIRLWIGCSAEA